MAGDQTDQRAVRLRGLLHSYIASEKTPKSAADAKLLFEAIGAQEDRAECIEQIAVSKNALAALKLALRFDVTPKFFNGSFTGFITLLRDPIIAQTCSGELLKQLLTVIVRPPTVWSALVLAHSSKQLSQEGEECFAWLLLELLSWVNNPPIDVDEIAEELTAQKSLLSASDRDLRALGYRIQHVLQTKTSGIKHDGPSPGGRHDNDYADFRKIAIYPTDDELMSNEKSFYRSADAMTTEAPGCRLGIHLDNQFRLLREDFLAELREDVNGRASKTKARRPRTRLQGLSLVSMHCGNAKFKAPFGLVLATKSGLGAFAKLHGTSQRKAYLKGNPKFLKNQSFGCVVDHDRVVTFATLIRDEDLLVRGEPLNDDDEDLPMHTEPLIVLRTPDRTTLERLLSTLKSSHTAEFIMVDVPSFAYEPVLRRLQSIREMPLAQELLAFGEAEVEEAVRPSPVAPLDIIDDLEADNDVDLQAILSSPKSVNLDRSQLQSLVTGLRQSVSLIQGPPGTGKSYVGALLAKALTEHTCENILVICFKNHALDQFLEDLLDIGIPGDDMVRLGSKCTARTAPLSLVNQTFHGGYPWSVINALKDQAAEHEHELQGLVSSLKQFKPDKRTMMEHLEFSDDDSDYFFALKLPELDPEEHLVGEGGKRVTEYYLYDRWCHGNNAGVFASAVLTEHTHIWSMDPKTRNSKVKEWNDQLQQGRIQGIGSVVDAYNQSKAALQESFGQRNKEIIRQKRIIGCTTTGAAMYTQQLRKAAPGIVIVEEAGEILESHVLAALTPSTKQLILIGDHKQLRPKVNNHALTVEKGEGYDLNRSLFERLILAGFPHTTLHQQHRMCPEISDLVRRLTYPDLTDAPSTLRRESLRGLCSRIVFVDHRYPELAASMIADRRDEGASVSKENAWEASMVIKIVRYMAQQGYGTANQVVLTPYLGQLSLLRRKLVMENDPVINDIDSFELIKAGLMSPSSAAQTKRPINLSTIDNYQGEECDVVIASLTRSNKNGDIGFMISPERLNVLLSRARKCLIVIGNSETFLASRKGTSTWKPFLDLLAENSNIYDGLPAKCEQHPDRKVTLMDPSDFDELCPDGGCSAPCGIQLSCGVHYCPQKCHARDDHSKMLCQTLVSDQCPKKHKLTWPCSSLRPASCFKCDAVERAAEKLRSRDEALDQARQQKQVIYARQLADIQDEINHLQRIMREHREDDEREKSLRQRQVDLQRARSQRVRAETSVSKAATSTSIPVSAVPGATTRDVVQVENHDTDGEVGGHAPPDFMPMVSTAQEDWENQKDTQLAENEQLDELMSMIGLENVKETFLGIKAKVDLTVRQGISLSTERFGASLLGNPGTGKTTIARLYGKFLASVGALPGDEFVETTGAKLANEGVQGCQKILDGIKSNGGGALFIDEAYQLSSGSNPGGSAVLDFLLAEIENLTGKVVFVLAGYNKNMESLFAHNPGLPSRFPTQIQFADYEDTELLEIFNYRLVKKYGQAMRVKGGSRGLYARILARRLGRGRGIVGFGNARAVENTLSIITSRQAKRIRRERREGKAHDDYLLTKADLIGPEPSDVLSDNQAWKKLQQMTGLSSVKDSIKALFNSITYNCQRELEEKPPMDFTLNKVFIGSPGTGKTSVAKLYGRILADLGLLSTNDVIFKTPADFVGNVLGASEANTKAILDAAIGKVLVIDEAYGLYSASDPYKTAVIDTIVAEVQSVPGDDRCVLLLGYKEQLEEMMQNSNPGLARRFPIDSGFLFEDFTDEEMAVIFDSKLKAQAFIATDKARSVGMEVLRRMRNRPNFGNAGQIDILLNDAKFRQQKRFARDRLPPTAIFEAEDFDPDHTRAERANTNIEMLFRGDVGCEHIVAQLQDYQNIAANMKDSGMDPRAELPFTFLFRGPPGTGKTSAARKWGKIYYDMGFLATAEVIECSAKDLVGEYVGQTGPKAQKLIESALGKVLFIDEAYRLGNGPYGKEAVDELVDCITKPQFVNKVVIILAGYDADINRLMDVNPGLSSRFPESVDFRSLKPDACIQLLTDLLAKKIQIDSTVLSLPNSVFEKQLKDKFAELALLANFANGRDVQTLSKGITGTIMKAKKSINRSLAVTEEIVITQIEKLIHERIARAESAVPKAIPDTIAGAFPIQMKVQDCPTPPIAPTRAHAQTTTMSPAVFQEDQTASPAHAALDETDCIPPKARTAVRDAGVTDEIWARLQADTRKAEEELLEREDLARQEEEMVQWLKKCADAKRQQELDAIRRKKKDLDEKLAQEAKEQAQLAQMGRCAIGYHWIRQTGGYRCAGGSHWVTDSQMQQLFR